MHGRAAVTLWIGVAIPVAAGRFNCKPVNNFGNSLNTSRQVIFSCGGVGVSRPEAIRRGSRRSFHHAQCDRRGTVLGLAFVLALCHHNKRPLLRLHPRLRVDHHPPGRLSLRDEDAIQPKV